MFQNELSEFKRVRTMFHGLLALVLVIVLQACVYQALCLVIKGHSSITAKYVRVQAVSCMYASTCHYNCYMLSFWSMNF